jgi:GR25 family glycosyltransferase involved in LPS biosynthesis
LFCVELFKGPSGCFGSHVKVYKHAAHYYRTMKKYPKGWTSVDYILVREDDSVLPENTVNNAYLDIQLERIRRFLDKMGPNVDILHLYGSCYEIFNI